MSKHLGRKQRWLKETALRYTSAEGAVLYERHAWYGVLGYKLRTGTDNDPSVWEAHQQRLGPFKRPRNAMVALEREATMLKNRHEPDILFGDQFWGEA